MAPGDLPAFPEETGFHYLAEGAANIVYRISIHLSRTPEPSIVEEYGDGTPPPSFIDDNPVPLWERPYEDRLVRFRKNLPTTAPCAVAQAQWERLIKPLFPEHQLVDQALVELKPGKIIAKLNEELRGWELYDYPFKGSLRSTDIRPTKRQGIYLADDDHALLVTDMTPNGEEEHVIEFKPKWLVQSPSAPKDSKRCRQCARMARENAQQAREGQEPFAFFCPLDLTSKNRHDILHVADLMLQPGATEQDVLRMAEWLERTTILENIKKCQQEFDKVGVIDADINDEKFLCAMTLRDCSVFVKTTKADVGEWDARIGDLDLKSKAKAEYWQRVERPLIEEGWYQGTEKDEDRQPRMCQLSPERFTLMPTVTLPSFRGSTY